MGSRKRMLAIIVLIAVAAGAGGWFLGRQIESPDEVAAGAAPPEASLITVPVEARTLSRDVIVRGDAQFEDSVDLNLGSALGGGATPIVTGRVPENGSLLNEGDVAIEVAGRPVFVLNGDLPPFRPLGPGLEGDDVRQLEEALARLELFAGTPDVTYDQETEDAVSQLYTEAGYRPDGISPEEEAELKGLRSVVTQNEEAVAAATKAVADAQKPLTESERLQLESGLASAQRAYDAALVEQTASRETDPAVSAAVAQRDAAFAAGASASELAGLDAQIDAAVDARDARIVGADAQVVSTSEQLAITRAQYNEQLAAPDLTQLEAEVTRSQEALATAEADLAERDAALGVGFPDAELVFLPDLPRRVTSVFTEPGFLVNGAVMRISGADVVIDSAVAGNNRPLIEVGDRVIIDDASLGIQVDGEITELADSPGTKGASETRFYMRILPVGDHDAQELVRVGNWRLIIPIERTEGEVTAVPLAALSAASDGSARVEIERSDGTTELLTVTVGLEAEGFVEVIPVEGTLEVGDRVVIGVDRSGVAGPDESDS